MCSEHGICQNYQWFWYQGYTKDDWGETVDDAEKGTEVKYVLAVIGGLFLVILIASWIINIIFKKPAVKRQNIDEMSDD